MIKYWVRYIVTFTLPGEQQEQRHDGEMGMLRAEPVADFNDMPSVMQAIASTFANDHKLSPTQQMNVRVLSWQRFEDASKILVPNSHARVVS